MKKNTNNSLITLLVLSVVATGIFAGGCKPKQDEAPQTAAPQMMQPHMPSNMGKGKTGGASRTPPPPVIPNS